MRRPLLSAVFCACVAAACSKNTPNPPQVGPAGPQVIRGTEGIGWTQSAASSAELNTFRYALYVDGVRVPLSNASGDATSSATSRDVPCTVRLPPLMLGAHTLELASYIVDGSSVLESTRSAALQVTVAPVATRDVPSTPEPAP